MSGLCKRQGLAWLAPHRAWFLALAGACTLFMSTVLAGCGSATSPKSVTPGFTGYVWRVVAISHDGEVTSVPARLEVALRFSPGGHFGASDSINFYSGTYRTTSHGFTTSAMSSTSAGYVGHDPAVLLVISAIGSFDNGAHASATVTTGRLVVRVSSYTLSCQRRSRQADVPAPAGTGG